MSSPSRWTKTFCCWGLRSWLRKTQKPRVLTFDRSISAYSWTSRRDSWRSIYDSQVRRLSSEPRISLNCTKRYSLPSAGVISTNGYPLTALSSPTGCKDPPTGLRSGIVVKFMIERVIYSERVRSLRYLWNVDPISEQAGDGSDMLSTVFVAVLTK